MIATHQFLVNGHSGIGLSLLDRGFAYGDGVFRTLRVLHGVPHSWSLHYRKLVEDCNVLGIVCPDTELLRADITHLFKADEDAVAKIIITRGESTRGYAVPALAQPVRIVIKTPLPMYPQQNYNTGVALHLCKLRLSHQPALAGIKHLNRLENVLARMEWTDGEIADGLLLDIHEHVIECTASNVFVRFADSLITPDLSQCGVAGITRQRILEMASSLGFKAQVAPLPYDKLLQADEFIICNSLYGAWQVRVLGERSWKAQGLATQLRKILQE